MMVDTEILRNDAEGISQAAALLSDGALVAFPTETVYGLGGDACNDTAVAGIFAAKGRPEFNPLIVHLADVATAQRYVMWNDTAEMLAAAFWPGPLTMVLPLRADHGLSPLVTAGLETVAIRVPEHPAAQSLLRAFGGPVAAPSANLSGKISPTTAAHVSAGLSGRIAAIVDDGPCDVGLESTIVGLTGAPVLLREGGIPAQAIEDAIGAPLGRAGKNITAPGQLASHYAPDAPIRLNARHAKRGEVHLGFGEIAGDLTLSASGDLHEAAARLFDALHRLNAMKLPIAVAPIPDKGLGRAINDRLRRAAEPRDG